MKKRIATLLALLIGISAHALYAGDNRPFDRAQRAMRESDYKSAIAICLGELALRPADYDVSFLLAQAYSRAGERDKAMAVLMKMEGLFPRNSDVILFVARMHTGKGQYAQAMDRYREVLEFAPDNEEALVGTADIAARQRDYARALSILRKVLEKNPANADAYYHLGLVYQWQGNTGQAREDFEKAAELAPGNEDYKVFLTRATPRLQKKYEVRYGHEVESWNDGRPDFQNDRLALHLDLPRDAGVLILKYNQTRRFGETDGQFGIESYPRLWAKAYGRFELDYGTRAVSFPRWSYLGEVYQGFLSAAEASFGVWGLKFPGKQVTVWLGSLGYYVGSYYPYVRMNSSDDAGHHQFSWVFNVRRYFSDENFVYAGYGQGALLIDNPTASDLLAGRGRIYLAGVTWYVWRKIRIEALFSRTTESSLARSTFQITAGYRWR
jgi:YaiO family outer membrane protein